MYVRAVSLFRRMHNDWPQRLYTFLVYPLRSMLALTGYDKAFTLHHIWRNSNNNYQRKIRSKSAFAPHASVRYFICINVRPRNTKRFVVRKYYIQHKSTLTTRASLAFRQVEFTSITGATYFASDGSYSVYKIFSTYGFILDERSV
jgi:hypothetical protein